MNRPPVLSASFLLFSTVVSHAQFTIARDTFELADHPTGVRTVVTGGLNGIPFYTRNATGASYIAGIVDDSGGLGTFVLNQTDNTTGAASQAIIGVLPTTITLSNTNDFIRLEFTFRYTALGTSLNNAGFRFGIFSDFSTPVTADNQGTASNDDRGYYVQNGVGTTLPGSGNTFYNEAGGTAPLLGGTDRAAIGTAGGSGGMAFNDTLPHTVAFSITRSSATAITLSVVYDGTTTITSSASTTNIRTVFNEIGFCDGFVASPASFNIDNVQVISSVPEPSTSLLALATLLSLITCRASSRRLANPSNRLAFGV